MTKTKKCLNCNKEFVVKGNNHKFCSKKCEQQHWNSQNKERKKFLFHRWYKKNYKKKNYSEKRCLECNKKFKPRSIRNKFCSRICSMKYWRKNNRKRVREQDKRWRNKNKKKVRINHNKAVKKWRKNNPEKYNAYKKCNRIPIKNECELCPDNDKRTKNLERHHPDYSEPTFFVTVCNECHKWIHHKEVN